MRKGLVLEGGGMRGMFTAGVLDVMMENKISFDGIAGVSAGAVFGCNFKSGQKGRSIRYNTRYCRDKRYCSLSSLIRTGNLYGVDFCYRELPENLDKFDGEAFEKNPAPFYVVATDIETGMPVYRRLKKGTGEDLLWFRASASLPFVSRPVEIGDRLFLDGGMSDSIPLRFMEGIGYRKNVVVLTRPDTYRKKEKGLGLLRLFLRKSPYLADAMEERPYIYNETLSYIREKEGKGEVFVIRPAKALEIDRIEKNPEKLRAAYEEGRRIAENKLNELVEFLRDNG